MVNPARKGEPARHRGPCQDQGRSLGVCSRDCRSQRPVTCANDPIRTYRDCRTGCAALGPCVSLVYSQAHAFAYRFFRCKSARSHPLPYILCHRLPKGSLTWRKFNKQCALGIANSQHHTVSFLTFPREQRPPMNLRSYSLCLIGHIQILRGCKRSNCGHCNGNTT